MYKLLYIILFVVGITVAAYGAINWGIAGFPFSFSELSTSLFGTKPWHLDKDSFFFFVVLGVFISAYALFELNLKRWQK